MKPRIQPRLSQLNAVIALGLALGLSACGGQPFTGVNTSQSTGFGANTTPSCTNDNCGGSTTGANQAFSPSMQYPFSITAAGGPTPNFQTTVTTDTTLKVRITPDTAPTSTLAGYQNWQFAYGCMSVTVTVAGRTVRTGILESPNGNSYYCRYAAWQNGREVIQSQVIDFSDRVTQGTPSYTVTVSSPQYDFYCNLGWAGYYVGPYNSVCPLRTTFVNGQASHRVNGFIGIQVDGTSAP